MTWKFIALAKEKGPQRVQDTSVSLGEAELVGENQVYREEWYLEMSSEGKEGNRIRKLRHLQKRMKNKTKNWLKKKKKDPENSTFLPCSQTGKFSWVERKGSRYSQHVTIEYTTRDPVRTNYT